MSRWLGIVAVLGLMACGDDGGTRAIARASADARLLGAHDGRVFWVEPKTSELHWVGGSYPHIGAGWTRRGNALVDASGLYFTHHNRLEHLIVDARGADVETLAVTRGEEEHPTGVARAGDCLYVLYTSVECHDNGALVGWPMVAGATCPRHRVAVNGLQGLPFAADARRFVWADSGCAERRHFNRGIQSLSPVTGGIEIAVAEEPQPRELELGAQDAYWRGADGIHRAPAAALTSDVVVPGKIHGFTVDRGVLFYADDRGVHARREDGGKVFDLSRDAPVTQIVADARYVYWIRPDGALMRRGHQ